MRFVKFVMSRGSDKTVDYDQAMRILASQQQIIVIRDPYGNITPNSLNKAHIVGTEQDFDAEREWAKKEQEKIHKLAEPQMSQEQKEASIARVQQLKKELAKKLGWKKV